MKFLTQRRRRKLQRSPFPEEWKSILERRVPLYTRLPTPDKREVHGHIHVLLHEKRFEGCGGLGMTDDIRLTIAAQAAVLLLHRETDYFPDLSSVLVYPSTYVASVTDFQNGIVTEFEEERAGETWDRGSLVLSWDAVTGSIAAAPLEESAEHPRRSDPAAADVDPDGSELVPAYNVVLHEFAHQLDLENGEMDGMPRLPSAGARDRWVGVMQAAYDQLKGEIASGREAVIDEYALEDPAEFFAVATESFFESPFAVLEEYPQLYDILREYYQQDPARWVTETG